MILGGAFCKTNYSLELFPKDVSFFDRDLNTFELLNIRVRNMPQIMSSEILGSEYTFFIGN